MARQNEFRKALATVAVLIGALILVGLASEVLPAWAVNDRRREEKQQGRLLRWPRGFGKSADTPNVTIAT